jgi:hypothetical protein
MPSSATGCHTTHEISRLHVSSQGVAAQCFTTVVHPRLLDARGTGERKAERLCKQRVIGPSSAVRKGANAIVEGGVGTSSNGVHWQYVDVGGLSDQPDALLGSAGAVKAKVNPASVMETTNPIPNRSDIWGTSAWQPKPVLPSSFIGHSYTAPSGVMIVGVDTVQASAARMPMASTSAGSFGGGFIVNPRCAYGEAYSVPMSEGKTPVARRLSTPPPRCACARVRFVRVRVD